MTILLLRGVSRYQKKLDKKIKGASLKLGIKNVVKLSFNYILLFEKGS